MPKYERILPWFGSGKVSYMESRLLKHFHCRKTRRTKTFSAFCASPHMLKRIVQPNAISSLCASLFRYAQAFPRRPDILKCILPTMILLSSLPKTPRAITIKCTIMIALAAVVLTLPSIITVSALTLTNPSLLLPNSTIVNANYAYKCSGASQGRNLDSASCMEALRQIDAHSTRQQTWGQRGEGSFDVKLPKRYTSCWSSLPWFLGASSSGLTIHFPPPANGLCVIEPRLVSGSSAHASLQEVAAAARTVIDRCVNMMPSQGGKARRIGE